MLAPDRLLPVLVVRWKHSSVWYWVADTYRHCNALHLVTAGVDEHVNECACVHAHRHH